MRLSCHGSFRTLRRISRSCVSHTGKHHAGHNAYAGNMHCVANIKIQNAIVHEAKRHMETTTFGRKSIVLARHALPNDKKITNQVAHALTQIRWHAATQFIMLVVMSGRARADPSCWPPPQARASDAAWDTTKARFRALWANNLLTTFESADKVDSGTNRRCSLGMYPASYPWSESKTTCNAVNIPAVWQTEDKTNLWCPLSTRSFGLDFLHLTIHMV